MKLKYNPISYVLALIMAAGTAGCSDAFLDTKPYDKIIGDQTWSNQQLADAYVTSIYSSVLTQNLWLSGYSGVYAMRSEASTKNARQGTLNSSYWSRDMAEGVTNDDNYGWISYGTLWRIHTAMEELSQNEVFPQSFIDEKLAELRFLRGAHYFLYARQYGGLQLIDRVLTLDDDMMIPRASARETYDFIIADLEAAAAGLPKQSEAVRGRLSKEAAYALIMRVANTAAAYVDGGKADSGYYVKTIQAGEALGLNGSGSQLSPYADMFSSYETAVASGEIILPVDRLKLNTSLYDTPMQYQGLWYTGNVSEYAKQHFPISQTMNFWGMDGGSWPTQDLVDDYMVRDTDGSVKLWQNASYIQTGANVDQKMYFSEGRHRDLRFYATVLYDSCLYFNQSERVFFRRDGNVSNSNSPINAGSEEEYGYKAGDLNNYNSDTGYGMLKYHYDNVISLAEPAKQMLDYCFVALRYGEAYMNMTEAYLMQGNFTAAKDFMIPTMVKHGGFSADKAAEYLAPLSGNGYFDSLFEAYKRERNVEMVYECNDRYWSLLRWGIRQSGGLGDGSYARNGFVVPELQGPMHGIKISRDGQTYDFFETTNPIGEARFSPRRYLLPINRSFAIRAGIEQNPGWE